MTNEIRSSNIETPSSFGQFLGIVRHSFVIPSFVIGYFVIPFAIERLFKANIELVQLVEKLHVSLLELLELLVVDNFGHLGHSISTVKFAYD